MANTKVKIGPLRILAIKNAESLEKEEDTRKIDLTDIFFTAIKERVRKGELLNISVRGEVTSGKSTVAIALATWINEKLLKQKMTLQKISADQIEFARKVTNPNLRNTCEVIDEWNALGETGYNATIEEAFLQQFSEVQAQRFIHRISCSPKKVVDPLANIDLVIIGKMVEKKITRCLLSVRVMYGTSEINQLIGYVDIPVGNILNKEFYKKYRKRKFAKMDLLNKKGVTDIREMEQAKVILTIVKKLETIAKYGAYNREIVKSFLEIERRKNKLFWSIIGKEDIIDKIMGVLVMIRQQGKLMKEIQDLKKKLKKTREPRIIREIEDKTKILEEIARGVEEIKKNYEELTRIQEEYQKI